MVISDGTMPREPYATRLRERRVRSARGSNALCEKWHIEVRQSTRLCAIRECFVDNSTERSVRIGGQRIADRFGPARRAGRPTVARTALVPTDLPAARHDRGIARLGRKATGAP